MVDPQPDVAPYLHTAAEKKLTITHVIETHVQANHVSGARALARATGSGIYLHEAAAVEFPFEPVRDGQELHLGNVVLSVWHTPGHTPDSISLVVTDRARGDRPWFVLTGDTLFAGGIGRPDLLGDRVEERLAAQLYDSVRRFQTLPDYVEVYPAHFSGRVGAPAVKGEATNTTRAR